MKRGPSRRHRPVVVTGATSGIGLELSGMLVLEGFRVFGGALPGEDTKTLAEVGATPVSMDVTNPASLCTAKQQVESALEGIPLWALVNSAGIVAAGPIELLDIDEARYVFEVNVMGVLATTQAFLPSIRMAKGRIVNISSLSGLLAVPFLGPYNASKSAMEALSDTMRRELQHFGIDVIIVQPGATCTPLWNKAEQLDLSRYRGSPYASAVERVRRKAVKKGKKGMHPSQVAAAILSALTDEKPPTRIRVQRKRSSRVRYSILPLLSDRIIDRMVAKRVWGE